MNSEQKRVVAFIPVRGGSKSIPLKNIKKIAGKPLVQWVVEAAAFAQCIDAVYVATDSAEIGSVVDSLGLPKVKVVGRSPETATDVASTESVLTEFCEGHKFNHLFLIQATSPLLTSKDLDGAWRSYSEGGYLSMLSVVRQKRFFWEMTEQGASPLNYEPLNRPRRQDFVGHLVENGAFYLSTREAVLTSQCRISGKVGLYEMSESTYYELDEPVDWHVVERLLREKKREQASGLGKIRMLAMDCDGVMTDAGMYYSPEGEVLKKFNTRDGKGIELLRASGVKAAIITGESSLFAQRRAEKLAIDYVVLGAKDKAGELLKVAEKSGISPEEIAYICDDVNDLPAIRLCGFSACPENAVGAVKDEVDMVLNVKGGEGAVRALADLLLGHV